MDTCDSINISVCKNCNNDIYPEDTSCSKCNEPVVIYRDFEIATRNDTINDIIDQSYDYYKKP